MENIAQRIGQCYVEACWLELSALKPGNVGQHADGHGMQVDQFVASATVSVAALTEPSVGVGERIYKAVNATQRQVGDNTNLGIVLLAAPLVEAALRQQKNESLRFCLLQVLNNLTVDDARDCYAAIRIANPGGMGEVDEQDLTNEPDITLLQVMQVSRAA